MVNHKPAKRRKLLSRRVIIASTGVIFLVLLSTALYILVYEPRYSGPIRQQEGKTLIFAHRGYGVHGPDNSLVASSQAVANGFDGVDVDGQLTKDGKIVVFHDLSLDRLTDASGKVSGKSLDELTKLDLAPSYKGDGYATAPVASFEDYVKAITPKATLMVELKVSAKGDTGIEKEALRIINKYDAFDKVYLSSFNPLVIHRLEKLDSRINTVYIFMDTNWNQELLAEMDPKDVVNLPWFLQNEPLRRGLRKYMQPDMLSVNMAVSAETRARLIDMGWPIFLWAPNDAAAIKAAIAQKPYGIISDEPILARQILTASP